MTIITGLICLAAFLILIAKIIVRKFGGEKLNTFFDKIHIPVFAAMIVICIVHAIFSHSLIHTRSVTLYATGACAFVIMLVIYIMYFVQKKRNKPWIKLHRVLSCIAAILIVGHIVACLADFNAYQSTISSIQISGVNISEIPDGAYTGECDAGYIYAKVRVTVKEGKITDIELLEHRNERGQEAESILDAIINEQDIDVDAVTSATNSSLVIKKAVENALNSI